MIRVELAPLDQHPGHTADDRLRDRHQQMHPVRSHPGVVPLQNDTAVMNHHDGVGEGLIQHVGQGRHPFIDPVNGDRPGV